MITDQQYTDWLNGNDALRCILVDVDVNSTTRYISNKPFKTSAADTPANTVYQAILVNDSIAISEGIEPHGNGASFFTVGDIELDNFDGSIDGWIDDIWDNRDITIRFGDIRWEKSDFRVQFVGVVAGVGSSSADTINLAIKDKLERLNVGITDVKLGGATNNKDRLLPLCYGECHNITPLLIDPVLLKYKVHNGAIEEIIEVRDEGVPVSVTKDLANGDFTLIATPAGLITASVQGAKPTTWLTKSGEIIKELVKNYGQSQLQFSDADINLTSFTDFNTSNGYPLGIYIDGRQNLLRTCIEIADSANGKFYINSDGKLELTEITLTGLSSDYTITDTDIFDVRILEKLDIVPVSKIGYAKNWTQQLNLETGIPNEHKDLFAKEWFTVITENTSVKSDYRYDLEPNQVDTFLLVEANADTVASKKLYDTIRKVYELTITSVGYEMEIGEGVTITSDRFGLSSTLGMVVGKALDLSDTSKTIIRVYA